MGRSGALLPVALALLSGCRALEVQKDGSERVEKLGAERAESQSLRADVGAERAEAESLQRERAQARVRADMAGSFDMFQESEQAWPQTPTVPHAPPALQGGITSDSMAEMQKLLEEKIAAITAEETKRKLKEAM
mmetsp:Transcript_89835/g.243658  ORF Transcript_89835/g.243658 Transcript_89835/m.243658 type:complete len:135 (-) Transcript_89835:196-600(-)